MAKVDLVVGIGAEYKGKPAFNKAGKDVLGLSKGVQTLAKAYIGLAGAQKAFRFGKASVKEFVADDKAAQQLARTITNLGMAYEVANAETLIAGLEKTYNVADDLLRPAFSKLISTTQSYTKSKELLTLALNASAGAGVDLNTTVNDLTQAYVGNTRGLNKYKLGLTKAELAGKSFDEIQQLITKRFQGQAALAAETYSGKIDALTIASNNAKETIGKGLVTAMQSIVGKDQGIKDATTAIDNMASSISLAIVEMGKLIGKFTDPALSALGEAKNRARTGNKSNPLFDFLYGKAPTTYDPMSQINPGLTPDFVKQAQLRAKADKEAAKRQKELAAMLLKQTKALKEQTALAKAKAVLDKASAVMNMDLIQNTAALMGKITADEALRLKLQQAILLGNTEQAGNLAQQLLSSQIAALKLSGTNPVDGWMKYLSDAIAALQQLRDELAKLGAPKVPVIVPPIIPIIPPGAGSTGSLGILPPGGLLPGGGFIPPMGIVPPGGGSGPGGVGFPGGPDPYSEVGNYLDAFARPNTGNSFSNIVISIDPTAAQYGISAAVVSNAANGNSNDFRRTGTGF